MTIKDLKKFIENIDDDVIIKTTEFNGHDDTEHDIIEIILKQHLNEVCEIEQIVIIR